MAVFRIEKTRDYTVMSNHHLKDRTLTLKSKGLLSMMLSLPDEWNYTTRGLAAICREGVDSIGAALKELETHGYIRRTQLRDEKGKITDTEYVIYEMPQCEPPSSPDTPLPGTAKPYTENPDMGIERPYFVKQQVEIVKEIRDFITASPEQHYTMEELSKRFETPVSSLKRCFKGVYGTAIYSFMRSYRMDMAGHLLAETGETVATIAAKVGYTNCSKFSEAFKEATGMTPIDYRKFKSHRE